MSYQEKRTITSMVSGLLILAAYCLYAFGKYRQGLVDLSDLKFWAGVMLLFIGIGVGAVMIIQILFHILLAIGIAVKERECDDKKISKTIEATVVEDEMDKLIELKALRISFAIAGVGFVSGLASLALGHPPAVMLNLLFLTVSLGSVAEGFMSLYYYRKGVRNG